MKASPHSDRYLATSEAKDWGVRCRGELNWDAGTAALIAHMGQ